MSVLDLRSKVREVPDWPTPGVGFKDISPLLADPAALAHTIDALAEWVREQQPDLVLGAEARGFILGAAIAERAGCGFLMARRPGKLPPETVSVNYALEYGQNSLELNSALIQPGTRVVIHDDVLATGGTVAALAGLLQELGAEIAGASFVIELGFLNGREKLGDYPVHALISY